MPFGREPESGLYFPLLLRSVGFGLGSALEDKLLPVYEAALRKGEASSVLLHHLRRYSLRD